MVRKIVINKCYGGFSLSDVATEKYLAIKGLEYEKGERQWFGTNYYVDGDIFLDSEIERDDPTLVLVVEQLGEQASGEVARLCVVEIPDDVEWEISEYDGLEHVAEVHRTWS